MKFDTVGTSPHTICGAAATEGLQNERDHTAEMLRNWESEQIEPGEQRSRIFQGHRTVAGAFVVNLITWGCAFSISTFFTPLHDTFDVSRVSLSSLFSFGIGLFYFLGVVTGPFADWKGPRWILLVGTTVVGAGLLIASQAQALWQVYFGFGIGIGVGVSCCYVPSLSAALLWFPKRRGLISGIIASGVGIGTLLVPIFTDRLIQVHGWRFALIILSAMSFVVGGAAVLAIRRPLRMTALTSPLENIRGAFLTAQQSRSFRFIFVAGLLASLGYLLPFVYIIDFAEQRGVPHATSVVLLGLIGVGSIGGRLFGFLGDWFGIRRSLAACLFAMAIVLAYWPWADEPLLIGLFVLTFGACHGGLVALTSPLISEHFSEQDDCGLSTILGLCLSSVGIGSLLGPPIAGYLHDVSHNYTLPICIGACFTLISAILILRIPEPLSQKTSRAS
jgi:MFS family permease